MFILVLVAIALKACINHLWSFNLWLYLLKELDDSVLCIIKKQTHWLLIKLCTKQWGMSRPQLNIASVEETEW